jgi:hypothetical protein
MLWLNFATNRLYKIVLDKSEQIVNTLDQGQRFGHSGGFMAFVVSGLFVLALSLSMATVIGTLHASAPQISAAIAARHGPLRGQRIVHIGVIRQTGWTETQPAVILPFKPRFAAAAALIGAAHAVEAQPLAA